MICFINDYEYWDDIIHEHACTFFENYSVHPNLLLASKTTWGRIDEYANVYNPDNIALSEEGFVCLNDEGLKSISSFITSEYELEFCLDEKVPEDYFILVFDEAPSFDGEAVEGEDETTGVYRRIA